MQRRSFLIEGLQGYANLEELRKSAFFAECGEELREILTMPEILRHPRAAPRLRSFLRVAQWNIEKGKQFGQILEKLSSDAVLKWADVILLNEADYGMSRSGNRHVARDLARALEMHLVFGGAHLELTKGTDEDQRAPGPNQESLQGNAVLSRYPIMQARVFPLPVCFEPFNFHEKRYGGRNCVWAQIRIGATGWWIGSVHLEVRDTPACRAMQMRDLVTHLPGEPAEAYLLGGDLNSNGFSRGTLRRTLASVSRLTLNPAAKIQEELCHPERGTEPLFRVAKDAGFDWVRFNSSHDTACIFLEDLEDGRMLPRLLRRLVQKRLERYGPHLYLKLDWLLARGVQGLREGELRDEAVGVSSLDPGCVRHDRRGPDRISDHLPIYADLRIEK